MKNILISCISKFDRNKLDQGAYTYQNQDLTVTAYQTNEACLKYLLSRLGADDQLDVHIRVQSNDVAAPGDFTMAVPQVRQGAQRDIQGGPANCRRRSGYHDTS